MQRRDVALLSIGSLVLLLTLAVFFVVFGRQSEGPTLAELGGQFQLVDTEGGVVTQDELIGKPTLLFFGFTYCPDVCPNTLFKLSRLIQQLGPQADQFNYLFVSLDWQRDGPEQLARYLSVFDERIRGLSGNEAQIDAMADAYQVQYERVSLGQGDYTLSHTAATYLLDREGNVVGTLAYDVEPEFAKASLISLLSSSAPLHRGEQRHP
ncbi:MULTISPECIES: SCO family protein [unclassified Halomonas]|uniref:SCO family protein n=1 Tax=unclassified Halomonas TaxID=2609666 RepID=UPI0009BE9528|nr:MULTISPECIES: SCO family protein [unclassified Halomonas]